LTGNDESENINDMPTETEPNENLIISRIINRMPIQALMIFKEKVDDIKIKDSFLLFLDNPDTIIHICVLLIQTVLVKTKG